MTNCEKIAMRKECNFLLSNIVNFSSSINSELRFIQNLWLLDIIDEKEYREGIEIVDRFSEEPYDTIIRILPKIVELINNRFPKEFTIIQKLLRINIISGLEDLNLVSRIGDYKIRLVTP